MASVTTATRSRKSRQHDPMLSNGGFWPKRRASHTGCHIRGVRAIRMPDSNRFHDEFTEPLDLPRDAEGRVDVQRTMQAITSAIEGWLREHPEHVSDPSFSFRILLH